MEKTAAEAEMRYRLARCVFSSLWEKGLISHADWCDLLRAAAAEYKPSVGQLEVESVALEIGYKG